MTLAPQMKNPFTGAAHRFPLIVGMDPGEHKGYALIDTEDIVERKSTRYPRVVELSTTIGDIRKRLGSFGQDAGRRPVWSVIELQYTERITTGEISPESIVKLAFRAGYMLRESHALPNAEEMFAATPNRWKSTIFHGGGTIRKDIFCERIKRQLVGEELEMLAACDDTHQMDVLDGIGIGWALYNVLHMVDDGKELTNWRVWPDRIIPRVGRPKKMTKRQVEKLRL